MRTQEQLQGHLHGQGFERDRPPRNVSFVARLEEVEKRVSREVFVIKTPLFDVMPIIGVRAAKTIFVSNSCKHGIASCIREDDRFGSPIA